jgi:hypothetical protein
MLQLEPDSQADGVWWMLGKFQESDVHCLSVCTTLALTVYSLTLILDLPCAGTNSISGEHLTWTNGAAVSNACAYQLLVMDIVTAGLCRIV